MVIEGAFHVIFTIYCYSRVQMYMLTHKVRINMYIEYAICINLHVFDNIVMCFTAVGCTTTEEDAFYDRACITHWLSFVEFIHSVQVWLAFCVLAIDAVFVTMPHHPLHG